MASKRSNSHLPEDITTHILLRLPFDSLLTCKLVSKQWKDLINHPNLLTRYNPKSSLSLFMYKEELYCLIINPHEKIPSGTVVGPHHPPFSVHHIPFDLRKGVLAEINREPPCLLSGSSNGIACVYRPFHDFTLFNVFNGASFTVKGDPSPRLCFTLVCYGFGYNRNDNDYKIMVVDQVNCLYWVYNVRNHAWVHLNGFPCRSYSWYYHKQACPVNGVLHWLVRETSKTQNKHVIVTYDLHTCKFGEILLPQSVYDFGLPDWHLYLPRVSELDGQICCWIRRPKPNKFELWVMKEYDVRESWTELISCSSANVSVRHWIPTSLYECRNGRKGVLFVSGRNGSFYWYDVGNGKIEVIGKTGWSKRERSNLNQDFGYIDKFLG